MKLTIVTLLLAFFLVLPMVQAETIKLIENTDRCIYDNVLEKDYCYSVYEICENATTPDLKKLTFQFDSKRGLQTDKELSYETKEINIIKQNCKRIKIEAWKNPYLDIDNIPCFDGNCHKKYAWWNSSWINKFKVTVNNFKGNSYPLQLNLTNSSMSNCSTNSDFADLRFVNETEDTELDYWFEYNTSGTGAYVTVWTEIDGNFFIYCNNSNASYKGDFSDTFVLGDDFSTNTTPDYSYLFGGGTGYYNWNNSCGTLPNGEIVSCLNVSCVFNCQNEYAIRSDVFNLLHNYTFRTRYNWATGFHINRIGMTDTGHDAKQYHLIDTGRDAIFFQATKSGLSDNYMELLGLTSGYSNHVNKWLTANFSVIYTGGLNNFTDFSLSRTDTGEMIYQNRIDYAEQNANYLYVYFYKSPSALMTTYIDYWFIDQYNDQLTYSIGGIEEFNVTPVIPPIIENATITWDIGRELPILSKSCNGNNLVVIRQRQSCLSDGTCETVNQTDVTQCAVGCEENLTRVGADCVPTTLETFTTGWGLFLVALVALMFGSFQIKKRRKKKQRWL